MSALVMPVSPVLAWRWARGSISDAQLIHGFPPGGGHDQSLSLFVISLRCPLEYRACLAQARSFPRPLSVVLRTKIPTLARFVARRWGMVSIFRDPDGSRRFWAGSAATIRWLQEAGRLPRDG